MIKTALDGLLILVPKVFVDHRGWFFESYNQKTLAAMGIEVDFTQDNHSFSKPRYTLRGIHFQNSPFAQNKLVRCTRGRIMDYAVDLRKNSPTYMQWVGEELSAENKKQLFIPAGFGHAFVTLEENCEVNYKVDGVYSPENERTIRFDDPQLAIQWPEGMVPVLSDKDGKAPLLAQSDCNFID